MPEVRRYGRAFGCSYRAAARRTQLRHGIRRRQLPPELGPRRQDLVHIAPLRGQFLLQEERQIHLAHETDPLRILAPGRGEPLLRGDAPHLGLEQPAHGKERIAQLLLRKLAEEIALVLVRIAARQQAPDRTAVGQRRLGLAAVVPRGHVVGTELQRLLQKDVEFDLAVAEHVRIGRTPPFVLGEHVVHHPAAIVLREVDHMQRNVQFAGHQLREDAVVAPRAVALQRSRRIVPVDHEESDHLVPLLFEQPGRHRRIHAARKSYHYACHIPIVVRPPESRAENHTVCADVSFPPRHSPHPAHRSAGAPGSAAPESPGTRCAEPARPARRPPPIPVPSAPRAAPCGSCAPRNRYAR